MRRPLATALALALAALAPAGARARADRESDGDGGQVELGYVEAERARRARVESSFRLAPLHWSNFFQASDPRRERDVNGRLAEARVAFFLDRARRFRLHVAADRVSYGALGTSPGVAAGFRLDTRRHDLDLQATLYWDRPTLEVRDELGEEDARRVLARYAVAPVAWLELAALASFEADRFARDRSKDGESWQALASLRLRPLGRRLVPEVALGRGERRSGRPGDAYGQTDLVLGLRAEPRRWLAVGASLRLRDRSYTVDDPEASNFGREDARRQWRLGADFRVSPHLALEADWTRESSDSSRENRDFAKSLFSTGVAVFF